MGLPLPLETALVEAAEAARPARDRWWIIGSAAVALHGGEAGEIADVDLLMSPADAARLLASRRLPAAPGAGGPLFRSEVFGRWPAAGIDIEVMGGLRLRTGREWRAVQPAGRTAVPLRGRTLFIPPRAELIAILRAFGREKDLRRAEALARLSPGGGDQEEAVIGRDRRGTSRRSLGSPGRSS